MSFSRFGIADNCKFFHIYLKYCFAQNLSFSCSDINIIYFDPWKKFRAHVLLQLLKRKAFSSFYSKRKQLTNKTDMPLTKQTVPFKKQKRKIEHECLPLPDARFIRCLHHTKIYWISVALNIRTSEFLLGYKKLSQCKLANQRFTNLMNLLFNSSFLYQALKIYIIDWLIPYKQIYLTNVVLSMFC